jgi:hypothetical protein
MPKTPTLSLEGDLIQTYEAIWDAVLALKAQLVAIDATLTRIELQVAESRS